MDEDPALPYFRAAAAAEGISLEAWARKAGILLPRKQAHIALRETPVGDGDVVAALGQGCHCACCERKGKAQPDI